MRHEKEIRGVCCQSRLNWQKVFQHLAQSALEGLVSVLEYQQQSLGKLHGQYINQYQIRPGLVHQIAMEFFGIKLGKRRKLAVIKSDNKGCRVRDFLIRLIRQKSFDACFFIRIYLYRHMHLAIMVICSINWWKRKELMWKWGDMGSVLFIDTISDSMVQLVGAFQAA